MPCPAPRVGSPKEPLNWRRTVPPAMVALVICLLSFAVLIEGDGTEAATQVSNHSASHCEDWGEMEQPVWVLEGEVGWLRCTHYKVYNYSATQAGGLSLFWYRAAMDQAMEEPIRLKKYAKDREWLWLEPATRNDSGKYICMLSNKTFCTRVTMRLEVLPRENSSCGEEQTAVAPTEVHVPIGSMRRLPCPDVNMLQHRNITPTTVTWYHRCQNIQEMGRIQMEVTGGNLTVYNMNTIFGGNYTCVVSYEKAGRLVNFTRVLHIVPVSNESVPQESVPQQENSSCGEEQTTVAPTEVRVPIGSMRRLPCPDVNMLQHRNITPITVTWYHRCNNIQEMGRIHMEVTGGNLTVYNMFTIFEGNYTCVVSYEKAGRLVSFTRVLHIVPVSNENVPKVPTIHNPDKAQTYNVKQGETAVLTCKALLPYLEGETQSLRWMVNGKAADPRVEPRYNITSRTVSSSLGDEIRETVLQIQDFSQEDMSKEYNCSANNSRGYVTRRAVLHLEKEKPYVELSIGLGVIMFVMLVMFVIYHVFWLELLLLYRSHFGSDERSTDDKEYDVYISYARHSEEEEFVDQTLRRVLENELGYSVCIFDRDSLPGGTITDETLLFVNRSRRQIVVVSPEWEVQGTQAMLELRAGLDRMMCGTGLRVILVQYRPIQRQGWVRELRRLRGVLALVRWEGERSQELSSRFWKRLQVELPLRRPKSSSSGQDAEDSLPLQMVTTDGWGAIEEKEEKKEKEEKGTHKRSKIPLNGVDETRNTTDTTRCLPA
ncbi:interleukin-1 receptor accessory protein-like isoform X1 [Engraulis encrasicolus]|uniref:interleukin-1 receptor accessory protein-like isoform X1 n=1 Tax=Engraulis encrasicolus TaxID=184585 RepID=UPI002FD04500